MFTNKREKNGVLLSDEDRISNWGHLLRKTSLDDH